MDVRAFGSCMSAPKYLFFFPGFRGPDQSFCPRTSAGISAWTSAGYPAPKLTLWAAFSFLNNQTQGRKYVTRTLCDRSWPRSGKLSHAICLKPGFSEHRPQILKRFSECAWQLWLCNRPWPLVSLGPHLRGPDLRRRTPICGFFRFSECSNARTSRRRGKSAKAGFSARICGLGSDRSVCHSTPQLTRLRRRIDILSWLVSCFFLQRITLLKYPSQALSYCTNDCQNSCRKSCFFCVRSPFNRGRGFQVFGSLSASP